MSRFTSKDLVEIMLGKELTNMEILQALREKFSGSYIEAEEVGQRLRKMLNSPSCYVKLGVKNRRRSYTLVSVKEEYCRRISNQKIRPARKSVKVSGLGHNHIELSYVNFSRDFNKLLKEVRQ